MKGHTQNPPVTVHHRTEEGEGSGRKAAPNCWEVGICVFTGFMTIVVMAVTKAYIGWVGLITQRFSTEFSF